MELLSLAFEDLKKENARLKALHSFDILDTKGENAFDDLVKIASYICGTPISLISLVDADRQWFKARKGMEEAETSRHMSFCSHAIQENGVMEVHNTLEDDRFKENPLVTGQKGIRFYAGAPFVTKDGQKLGTLCVLDKVPRTLTEEQKECLQSLSKQVMDQMLLKQQKRKLLALNNNLVKDLEDKLVQQNQVLKLFTRFVPESIVAKHLQAGNTNCDDAEIKHLAILFCDIRGYTAMVENLQPQEAVSILSCYYSVLSEVIYTFGGMVNQYVGDEIFATFGSQSTAENHEKMAVLCALEMINKLQDLHEQCRVYTVEPIKIGIGIHAGQVITSTLGCLNKIEYSITGDPVNTGKRIESLTKGHSNTILISEAVLLKVQSLVEVKSWPSVKLKGKGSEVGVFEVVGKR